MRRSECKTRYTTCVHSVYTPGHIPRVCTPLGDSCVLHSQLTYASVPTHMYGCLSCLSFETLSCPSPFSPGPGPRLSRTELTKRFMLMREAIRPARPGDPPETRDIFSKIFQKFACVNRDLPCQNLPLLRKKSPPTPNERASFFRFRRCLGQPGGETSRSHVSGPMNLCLSLHSTAHEGRRGGLTIQSFREGALF